MTSEEANSKRAQRWIAYYKFLAWTSYNQRVFLRVRLAMSILFVVGVISLFWSPAAGVFVMFAAVSPIVLFMLICGVLLIHAEVSEALRKDKT